MSSRGMFPVSVEVLTKSLSFYEERHRIIANNIANADTPFFKAKRAPLAEFQKALSEAIEARQKDPSTPFVLRSTPNVKWGAGGLKVTALEAKGPDGAILRHDQNNVSLEKEMASLAENTLMYRAMSDLLRKQFSMLRLATRGRLD